MTSDDSSDNEANVHRTTSHSSSSSSTSIARKNSSWRGSQTELLVDAVAILGDSNWRQVAYLVPSKTAGQCAQQWARVANPRLVKGVFSALELERLVAGAAELGADSSTMPSFGVLAEHLGGHRSDVQTRYAWLKLQRSRATTWEQDEDNILVQLVERFDERAPGSLSWAAVSTAVSGAKLARSRTALCCRLRVEHLLANPALFRRASTKYCSALLQLPTMELLSMAIDAPLPPAQRWVPSSQQVSDAQSRFQAAGVSLDFVSSGELTSSSQTGRESVSPPTTPKQRKRMTASLLRATKASAAANAEMTRASTPRTAALLAERQRDNETPALGGPASGTRLRKRTTRSSRGSTNVKEESAAKRAPRRSFARPASKDELERQPEAVAAAPVVVQVPDIGACGLQGGSLAFLAAFVENQFFEDSDEDEVDVPLARLAIPMDLPMPPSLLARVRRLEMPPTTASSLLCDEQLNGLAF